MTTVLVVSETEQVLDDAGDSRDAITLHSRVLENTTPADQDVWAWIAATSQYELKQIEELSGGFVAHGGDTMTGDLNMTTSDILPTTDNTGRLGLTGKRWTSMWAYAATFTNTVTATTFSGALSGNADTATLAADATTLETPRAINGVDFDGSANITVTAAAGTLTGTTLNATVVSSSLTSLGTIGSLVATTVDINGGTIDGTNIGVSAQGSLSATTGEFSGDLAVLDDAGLVVGHTSLLPLATVSSKLQQLGMQHGDTALVIGRWSVGVGAPSFRFYKSRGATIGSTAAVNSGDVLGRVLAFGDDGIDPDTVSSAIEFGIEGSIGAGQVPGVIRLQVAAAGTLADALVIDSTKAATFASIVTLDDETDTTGVGTGALRVAGGADFAKDVYVGVDLTVVGSVILAGGDVIRTDTSDGSDNASVQIGGGGSVSNSRGGLISLFGNEHANTGQVQVSSGNVAGATLELKTPGSAGVVFVTSKNALAATWDGANTALAGNLTVTKATYRANSGGYYWSAQGTAAVGTQGVYVKVSTASTTTSARAENFTIDTNNRATYTGTSTQTFRVTYIVTMTAETASRIYGLRIAKTGTSIVGSTIHRKIGTVPGDEGAVMVEYFVELATNDYVELFATDTEGTADVMIEHGTCTITEA